MAAYVSELILSRKCVADEREVVCFGDSGHKGTVEALKKAAKGLRMPSETDAPFDAFAWADAGELTADRMIKFGWPTKGNCQKFE